MAFTRCRNFDDDGRPIRGGCPQQNCRFIHPDNPSWKAAFKYNGGSRQGSFSRAPPRGNSGSWKSPSDGFSAPTSTNTTKLPETGNRWGSAYTSGDRQQASGSNPSMPKEGDRFKPTEWKFSPKDVGWAPPTSGGWGSSGDDSGWGQASTSAWATTSTETSTPGKGSGWGQASASTWATPTAEVPTPGNDSGWGQASASTWATPTAEAPIPGNDSGWGQASTSTWATTTAEAPTPGNDSGWGQASASTWATTAEAPNKTPTPPRKALPLPRRSGVPPSQKPQLLPLNTNVRGTLSSTPTPSQPSIHTPINKHPPANDTLEIAAGEPSSTKQTFKLLGKPYPKQYIGPNGRVALFSDILSRMQDAIIAEIIYQRVSRDNARWKQTQESEIFGHATPKARKILDGNRNEFTRRVADAKKKRDIALTELIQLPDFDTKKSVMNPVDTMEKVSKYTNALKIWFIDAKIHERLLIEKKLEEDKARLTHGEAQTTPQLSAKELLERGNWTWGELSETIKILDANFASASEQVYSKTYVNYDAEDFQDHLRKAVPFNTISPPVSPEPAIAPQEIQNLENAIKTVGDELFSQAGRAAVLYEKIGQMNSEYAMVVEEKNKIKELCEEAEKQFSDFEKAKGALEKEIDDLKRQLQTLHLHKRPSPSPPTIDYDEILDQLKPGFQRRLEADLNSIFDPLRQRVLECQDDMKTKLDNLLKPILTKTDEMRRAAANN